MHHDEDHIGEILRLPDHPRYLRRVDERNIYLARRGESHAVQSVCVGKKSDLYPVLLDDADILVIILVVIPSEERNRLRVPEINVTFQPRFFLVEHMIGRDIDDVEPEIDKRLPRRLRTVEVRVARDAELITAERRLLIHEREVRTLHEIRDVGVHIDEVIILPVLRAVAGVGVDVLVNYVVTGGYEMYHSVRRLS